MAGVTCMYGRGFGSRRRCPRDARFTCTPRQDTKAFCSHHAAMAQALGWLVTPFVVGEQPAFEIAPAPRVERAPKPVREGITLDARIVLLLRMRPLDRFTIRQIGYELHEERVLLVQLAIGRLVKYKRIIKCGGGLYATNVPMRPGERERV